MVRKSIFYVENAVYFVSEILTLHLHFFCLFAIQSNLIEAADYFLLLMKHQLNRMEKTRFNHKKRGFAC